MKTFLMVNVLFKNFCSSLALVAIWIFLFGGNSNNVTAVLSYHSIIRPDNDTSVNSTGLIAYIRNSI